MQLGGSDIAGDSWVGVLVPAGTPREITATLHRKIVQIIAEPDITERLATLGYEPVASTAEEFGNRIKVELEIWRRVIQSANIKMM
jgi:tripartite-type tricarboxylate transporter receptor subunit TctC